MHYADEHSVTHLGYATAVPPQSTMQWPVIWVVPTIRHNKILDITATLLTEICHNVTTEPHLHPLLMSLLLITQPTLNQN